MWKASCPPQPPRASERQRASATPSTVTAVLIAGVMVGFVAPERRVRRAGFGAGGGVEGWIVVDGVDGDTGAEVPTEPRSEDAIRRANALTPALLPRWIPSEANQLGCEALIRSQSSSSIRSGKCRAAALYRAGVVESVPW